MRRIFCLAPGAGRGIGVDGWVHFSGMTGCLLAVQSFCGLLKPSHRSSPLYRSLQDVQEHQHRCSSTFPPEVMETSCTARGQSHQEKRGLDRLQEACRRGWGETVTVHSIRVISLKETILLSSFMLLFCIAVIYLKGHFPGCWCQVI